VCLVLLLEAYFRPPRDTKHYSMHIYATTTAQEGRGQQQDNKDYALPAFMSSDFHFYSKARNRIEEKFLSFEDYLLRKIYDVINAGRQAREDIATSAVLDHVRAAARGALMMTSSPNSTTSSSGSNSAPSRGLVDDMDLSNLNDLSNFWQQRGGDSRISISSGSQISSAPPPGNRSSSSVIPLPRPLLAHASAPYTPFDRVLVLGESVRSPLPLSISLY
jgi:hypothetical protein